MSLDAYETQMGEVTDKGLRRYLQNTEAGTASTKGFAQSLAQPTTRLGAFGKALAGTVLNVGASLAIEAGLQLAAKAWDSYSNRQENAIERGNEALTEHQENLADFQTASNTVDEVGERFEELRKEVSSSGTNIGLTNDEFEEYQNIVSQLATSMPELVSGYDSLGNPIISAVSNIEDLTTALQEQQKVISDQNIAKAKDYTDSFNAQVATVPDSFTEETGLLAQRNTIQDLLANGNAARYLSVGTNDLVQGASSVLGEIFNFVDTAPGNFLSKLTGQYGGIQALRRNSDIEDVLTNSFQARDIAEAAGISDEVLEAANSSNKQKAQEATQYIEQKLSDLQKTTNQELDAAFSDVKPFIESTLTAGDTNSYYNRLQDETKNIMSQVINGMDFETGNELGFIGDDGSLNTDAIKQWGSDMTRAITQSGVEEQISDLFALKDSSGEMTYQEYAEEFNTLASSIQSKVPQLTKDLLGSTTGISDSLYDMKQLRKDLLNDGIGLDTLNQLSAEDLEIVWRLNANGMIDSAENVLAILEETKKAAEESPEYFDDWQTALESPNDGDKYKTMQEGMEAAKAAYDAGETGTDDFKTFASMISPTGSNDAANFAENYGKFQRYFTEDKAGVNNLINDLSSLTSTVDGAEVSMATLDETTGKWKFNISDVDGAAQKLGISTEMLTSAFGRMRDYGIDNNIVGSVEDGTARITSLTSNLADEQARYNKLISETPEGEQGYSTTGGAHTFGNQTAIDASQVKLDEYNANIMDTIKNTQMLLDSQTAGDEAKTKSAIDAVKQMEQARQEASDAGLTDTATMIQEQMDAFAGKYKFDLEAELNYDEATAKDDIQNLLESATNKEANGKNIESNLSGISDRIAEIAAHDGDVSALVSQFNDLAEMSNSSMRMDASGGLFNIEEQSTSIDKMANKIEKLASKGKSTSDALANMGSEIQKMGEAGLDIQDEVDRYNELAEKNGEGTRMKLTGEIVEVEEYKKELPDQEINAKFNPESLSKSISDSMSRISNNAINNDTPVTADTLLKDFKMSDYIDQIHEMTNGNNEVALKFGLEGNETPEEIAQGLLDGVVKIPAELDFTGSDERTDKIQKTTSDLLEQGVQKGYATSQSEYEANNRIKRNTERGALTGYNVSNEDYSNYATATPQTGFTTDSETYARNMESARQAAEATSNAMAQTAQETANTSQSASESGGFLSDLWNGFKQSFTGVEVQAGTLDELEKRAEDIQTIDGQTATATVETKVEGGEEIQQAENAIQEVDGKRAEAQVDIQSPEGEGAITDLASDLQSLSGEETEIPISVKIDEGQFSTLFEGMTGESIPIDVEPEVNTSSLTTNIPPATQEVNQELGETVEGEEPPPTTQTVNQELGETVEGETPPPVTQTVNQALGETVNAVGAAEPVQSTVDYSVNAPAPPDFPDLNPSVTYHLSAPAAPSYPNISRSITYTINTIGSIPSYQGTAHALGTIPKLSHRALAMGSLEEDARFQRTLAAHPEWQTKQDDTPLVGELGRELVVSGNRWYTVGENGAEFSAIPAGSIIFNHKQTEELLSKGSTNGRGTTKGTVTVPTGIAHAQGTALASGTSSDSGEGTTEKTNWIERLLSVFERRIDRYEAKADNAKSYKAANKFLSKAITTVSKSVTANENAIKKYQKELSAVGISDDLKKKVQNGSLDISTLSDDQQKLVDEYTKWYDKIQDCKDAIIELKAQQKDLQQQKLDHILDKYEASQGRFTSRNDTIDARLSYMEARGETLTANPQYRSLLNEKSSNLTSTLTSLYREQSAYAQEMKKAKKEFGANSVEYHEAQAAFNGIKEEIWSTKEALEENQKAIREITYTLTQNLLNKLEQFGTKLASIVDIKLARNQEPTESDYRNQMTNNDKQIVALQQQYEERLAEAHRHSTQSDAYQDAMAEADDVYQQMVSLVEANDTLRDSIRELRWKPFNDLNDVINHVNGDIDHLLDLLDSEAFVSIGGDLTEDGAAGLMLMENAIANNEKLIANYQTGIKKLDEELKNGNISQEDYKTGLEEFLSGIQSATKANDQYKDSIVDVYKAQIEADNDVLQKNIDKRKEALDEMQNYYNWQRNIRDKNKDINSLTAQIAALENTSNAVGQAKLAELRAQLAEAQQDLNDDIQDREIETRQDSLDSLSQNSQDILSLTNTEIEKNAEFQNAIVKSQLDDMVNMWGEAVGKINSLISSTGTTLLNSGMASNILGSAASDVTTVDQALASGQSGAANTANQVTDGKGTTASSSATGVNTSAIPVNQGEAAKVVNAMVENKNNAENLLVRVTGVSVSPSSLVLEVGKTYALTAKVTPANATIKDVIWKTSASGTVSVNELTGVIRGEKKGSATITCASNDQAAQYVKATVSVKVVTKSIAVLNALAGKTNKGTSALNKYLAGQGYGQISEENAYKVAKALGVSGVTKTNIFNASGGTKRQKAIIAALKKAGYSTGGLVDNDGFIPASMVNGVVGSNGDDGIATVQRGEVVLTKQQAATLLNDFIPQVQNYNNLMAKAPDLSNGGQPIVVEQHNELKVGTITQESLPQMKKILDESYKYTSKMLKKDLNKMGYK